MTGFAKSLIATHPIFQLWRDITHAKALNTKVSFIMHHASFQISTYYLDHAQINVMPL